MTKNKRPKILVFDVETAPIISFTWGLFEQNVALNQIKSDWHLLSWAAKWLDAPANKIMYMDQRNAKDIENDKKILEGIWKLLDEADIVLTQNGVSFDSKKLNARFVLNGMNPPSPYKHIDTLKIAKKNFAFTSNKLAYMSDKLCTKYKKLEHTKFSGFDLWKQCLAGNKKAWDEMKRYNIYDVLSLEELYNKLAPWDNSVNFNLYSDDLEIKCNCGSSDFEKRGFNFSTTGKFQRYQCRDCGKWTHSKVNLLSKEKKATLRK